MIPPGHRYIRQCVDNPGRTPKTTVLPRTGIPPVVPRPAGRHPAPRRATPSQAPRLTPPPHQAHPVCPNRDAQPPCRNDPQDQRDDEGEESKREGRNKHPDKRLLMCHRRKRPGLPEFGVSRAVSGLPCPPRACRVFPACRACQAGASAPSTFLSPPTRSAPGTNFWSRCGVYEGFSLRCRPAIK